MSKDDQGFQYCDGCDQLMDSHGHCIRCDAVAEVTDLRRQLADQQTALAAMREELEACEGYNTESENKRLDQVNALVIRAEKAESALAAMREEQNRLDSVVASMNKERAREQARGDEFQRDLTAARAALGLADQRIAFLIAERNTAESALAARPTWAEIAKLPSPVPEGVGTCEWCHAVWDDWMPHPDNGCLWPRAQAAIAAQEKP